MMRSTVVRRSAVAASALSLALLVTACGGSEAKDDTADSKADTKSEEKDAEEPEEEPAEGGAGETLSVDELEELALAEGDVDEHKIGETIPGVVISADAISVVEAAWEPMAYALSNVPVGESAAAVYRRVMGPGGGDMPGVIAVVSLFSYEGEGAGAALGTLRGAAEDCADGFTMTRDGSEEKVARVSEEEISGGDEASAWTVMMDQEGMELPFKLVVVRQGATVATVASIDFGAAVSGEDSDLPTAVIDAQLAKLG
jgi:hypothetical protein